MIVHLNVKGKSQVVDRDSVQGLSCHGWKLVATYIVTEIVSKRPRNQYGSEDWSAPTIDTPTQVAYFVMELDEKSAVAEAERAARDSAQQSHEAQRDLRNANDALTKVEKQLAEEKSDRTRLEAEVNRHRTADRNKDERFRKMEGDLGKLREALGELRMKEILG